LGAVMIVIVWQDLQLPMQSVPITTNVVSSNPVQAICLGKLSATRSSSVLVGFSEQRTTK
jgi:hypothetical protein